MSACKGCGKEVIFAKDEKGKTQILDTRAPVYALTGPGLCERTGKDEKEAIYVSHFATCRDANQFSGKNKEVAKPPQ